jgi:CRP/FNR family transcriptional regulator
MTSYSFPPRAPSNGGPAIRAPRIWASERPPVTQQLLSDEERAQLAVIATIVRFKKGQKVYAAGDPIESIYNIISGVVKSYTTEPDNRRRINGFLFAGDLLGLSDDGHYANSAQAITPVTAYRLPLARLQRQLRKDSDLEFHVICKLCHELRQAQRHAFLLTHKDAAVKLAMFLQFMEQLQADRGEPNNEIHLPMARTEIGEFVGLSLAAVSRGFRRLTTDGVELRNRHHVKVRDREAFNCLAGLSREVHLLK